MFPPELLALTDQEGAGHRSDTVPCTLKPMRPGWRFPAGRGSVASAGPVAIIDRPSCVLLARYLRVVTRALDDVRLAAIAEAVRAIDDCAEAQRQPDRQAFAVGATSGRVSVARAAELARVSERAIRARLGPRNAGG